MRSRRYKTPPFSQHCHFLYFVNKNTLPSTRQAILLDIKYKSCYVHNIATHVAIHIIK